MRSIIGRRQNYELRVTRLLVRYELLFLLNFHSALPLGRMMSRLHPLLVEAAESKKISPAR